MRIPGNLRSTKFSKWLLGGLLFAMVLVAYVPAMRGGFVWDDNYYVTNNPTLTSLAGLRRIWIEPQSAPQYYPLVFTSFWIQYHIWALQPFAYHFVNVLLHTLNALLVWLILLRLRVPGAWMAAAIFALHPVHLESVAWITERKNVLSGFFFLSALLVYLRFSLSGSNLVNDSSSPNGKTATPAMDSRHIGLYLLAMFLFLCALLSKSVTCTLPAIILLLLWWKRDRISWHDIWPLVPLFILGAVLATTTTWMEKHHVGAQGQEWAFSIIDRCLIAGRALWFYAGKLVFPYRLSFIYPRWQIDSGCWWQYLFPASAMAVIVLLWLLRKRIGKAPLVAVLAFSGVLLPALGFINFYPMRFSFVADHFQYLASIGLIALFAGLPSKTIGSVINIVILVILGVLVWQGGHKYKDLETLWRDTISKNPGCWMAHNNLGLVLEDQGERAEAISHYQEALRIRPNYEEAHYNLGLSLERQGHIAEAIGQYREALRVRPTFEAAHNNLGLALERQGKVNLAISHYYMALRINPNFEEAHNNLGLALVKIGRLDDAIRHFHEALRINPDSIGVHNNLGLALRKQGKIADAIGQYREVLRIDPGSVEARGNLGLCLAQQGRLTEAIRQYLKALQIRPDSAEIHINLGNALVGQGRLDDAIDQYQKALAIDPSFIQALNNLGVVYTRKKEYKKAVSTFKRLLELRPDIASAYYNIVRIYSKQDKVKQSFDWLKRAITRGYLDWNIIKTDKDLENFRRSSYYKDLLEDH